MKNITKIFSLALIGLTALGSSLGLKRIGYHIEMHKAGASYCSEFGNQSVEKQVYDLTQQALAAMGVKKRYFISIYKGNNISCAASWQIWLDEKIKLGPWQFAVFHEAAHIALGHFEVCMQENMFPAKAHAQEIEADLLACQTLFELGMKDIIIERAKLLKQLIEKGCRTADLSTHPPLTQMYGCLCEFLKSKGIVIKF